MKPGFGPGKKAAQRWQRGPVPTRTCARPLPCPDARARRRATGGPGGGGARQELSGGKLEARAQWQPVTASPQPRPEGGGGLSGAAALPGDGQCRGGGGAGAPAGPGLPQGRPAAGAGGRRHVGGRRRQPGGWAAQRVAGERGPLPVGPGNGVGGLCVRAGFRECEYRHLLLKAAEPVCFQNDSRGAGSLRRGR